MTVLMDEVLSTARQETKTLVDETPKSTTEDVQFAPQAWTREGRTD